MESVPVEEIKSIVRRLFEELEKRNIDMVDEYFSEDFVNHSPLIGCTPDRQGLKDNFTTLFEAFPDLQFVVNDTIVERDKSVTHFFMKGTHTGPFLGMQPTGNAFEVPTISIVRFEGDKIVERWNVTDSLTMFRQLDLVSLKGVP